MTIIAKTPFPSDMPEDERSETLEQLLDTPTEQAKQEAKASQEAVAMFAEYQKKQLFEARLISVATPLLAAMIANQGVALAASLIPDVNIEMSSQDKMIDGSIELAVQLIEKISKKVND